MGYVLPKEQEAVKKARNEKRFLESLLAKIKTTLTVEKAQPGLRRMYFTYGKYLFATEVVVKPKRSQIYVEALLAKEFVPQLQSFVCGNEKIITDSFENEIEQNVITDFLATTLKAFLSPEFSQNGLQDAPFLIKSIWEKYMEIYHSAEHDILNVDLVDNSRHHPVSEYLSAVLPCEPIQIKLFDVQLTWPCTFQKHPIFLQALVNAPYIPLHVRCFLADLCTKLDTNIKLEGIDSHTKREYFNRYNEMISISLYQWHWLTNCSADLQLEEGIGSKDLQRTLKLFETDLAIQLYNTIIERLEIPKDIRESLELAEKHQIAQIAQSVVILMETLRDYEFKCLDNAWDTADWKNHVKSYWSEAPKKKQASRQAMPRMAAGRDVTLSPPPIPLTEVSVPEEGLMDDEFMSCEEHKDDEKQESIEEDDSYYIRQDCLDVLAVEDFASCTIEMDEIEPIEANPLRIFLNKVLSQTDARLQVILKKQSEGGSNVGVIILNKERTIHSTKFCFKNTESLLDSSLNELILSLKDRLAMPFEEYLNILTGEDEGSAIRTVVDYLKKKQCGG